MLIKICQNLFQIKVVVFCQLQICQIQTAVPWVLHHLKGAQCQQKLPWEGACHLHMDNTLHIYKFSPLFLDLLLINPYHNSQVHKFGQVHYAFLHALQCSIDCAIIFWGAYKWIKCSIITSWMIFFTTMEAEILGLESCKASLSLCPAPPPPHPSNLLLTFPRRYFHCNTFWWDVLQCFTYKYFFFL